MRAMIRTLVVGLLASALMASSALTQSSSAAWSLSYVIVAVGGGAYDVRDSHGTFTSTLPAPNPAGTSRGCAVDSLRNLYTVDAGDNAVRKYAFDTGQLVQTIPTAASPQSIVFDALGNFYVGLAGGSIQKYNAAGVAQGSPITGLPVDSTTTFSLDLAADQTTAYYVSGGQTVRTVDLTIGASSAQLFVDLEPHTANDRGNGLRLLRARPSDGPNALIGGLLVAYGRTIQLLSSTGSLVATFDKKDGSQDQDDWFAVALDPADIDPANRRFWAGDRTTGKLWRFEIDGGGQPDLGPFLATSITPTVGGLCVVGEPTQGQYTRILTLSSSVPSGTATFNEGTPQQHRIIVSFVNVGSQLRVAVSAREVESDGICGTDPNDVDCGFVQAFGADPALPAGVPYVNGNAVHYIAEPLRPLAGTEDLGVVTVESVAFHGVTNAPTTLPPCTVGSVILPRAARLLHDPTETSGPEFFDFEEDGTLAFYIDEWGESGDFFGPSRFMGTFRCSDGFSFFSRPEPGRTFKAGQSVPIEVNLFDRFSQPITDANTGDHRIILTLGFAGQVLFTFNTPGESYQFWNQLQPGTYRSQLQTAGLTPSTAPYYLCISDHNLAGPSNDPPLYPQNCTFFFVK